MKKKDYIENIIKQNLDSLNNEEPEQGHFDRFELKLRLHNKKKTISFEKVWKITAAVIFVLFIVKLTDNYILPAQSDSNNINSQKENSLLSTTSPEYSETEFYYTNAINVGLNKWEKLISEGYISKVEQEMMTNELTEFESRLKDIQNDLEANPYDERVINAMLEYYQAKLSVINMIVTKLEEVKQQKNEISGPNRDI